MSTQFPRRARRRAPGAMMTPAQFYALAVLIRTTEPSRSAARLVLVDGMHPAEAAERAGVSRQSAYNTTDRVRVAYARICEAGPWPEMPVAGEPIVDTPADTPAPAIAP